MGAGPGFSGQSPARGLRVVGAVGLRLLLDQRLWGNSRVTAGGSQLWAHRGWWWRLWGSQHGVCRVRSEEGWGCTATARLWPAGGRRRWRPPPSSERRGLAGSVFHMGTRSVEVSHSKAKAATATEREEEAWPPLDPQTEPRHWPHYSMLLPQEGAVRRARAAPGR